MAKGMSSKSAANIQKTGDKPILPKKGGSMDAKPSYSKKC